MAVFKVGSAIARAMPPFVAEGAARVAGVGAAHTSPERRAQVERNLRRVYGPAFGGLALRRAVDKTFVSYARYWAESFRLPGTSPAVLDAGMEHEGIEYLDAALAEGRGAVLAIPHLGGWEWAGFWEAAVRKHPITVVVEMLDPPELFEWFVDMRRSFGMNVVPLGPAAGGEVVRALKANHVVCLLCDRDIAGGGVEVEFFGERTRLPAGPATLALRSGAPLIPTAAYFRGRGHLGVCRPPVPLERQGRLRDDVARVTQLVAYELEALIRAAPEQWHLMQPNWPSDYEAVERGAVP
ncbi:MAG: phosphatidylinositol dimannoside acyltransferase [Acidimicrobiaceae bacterium]|jgi:KDO2-lipid IV(A) lauroyltransferase